MFGILIYKVLIVVSCFGVDKSLFKCRMLLIVGVEIEMIYMYVISLVCLLRNIILLSDFKNKK